MKKIMLWRIVVEVRAGFVHLFCNIDGSEGRSEGQENGGEEWKPDT
jgi:hypothetical protein